MYKDAWVLSSLKSRNSVITPVVSFIMKKFGAGYTPTISYLTWPWRDIPNMKQLFFLNTQILI